MDKERYEKLKEAARAYINLLDEEEAEAVYLDIRELAYDASHPNTLLRPLCDAAEERADG